MKSIQVAVAVIQKNALNPNDKHNYLISKRAANVHQELLWEFPGGKVESDEDVSSALVRECQEELDISPVNFSELMTVKHEYPDLHVELHVYLVGEFLGEPKSNEGQEFRWVKTSELLSYEFPEANKVIIDRILSL